MEDGFRLQDAKVVIVGLGLIGGSLAMALKGKCALYGIDSDRAAIELALDKRIVDQADTDPGSLASRADLVLLAAPVPGILEMIRRLPVLIQNPCIVLDVGSTKKEIVQAMAALPDRFDPIGGHPICGKEKPGLANAEPGLFEDAPFVLTPVERTSSRARDAARQLILAVGARPVEMDAGDHDRILAFTSHLPFLVSSALVLSTPNEFAPLTGTGFRSTGRLSGTSSSIMLGILQSNRENVLRALSVFQKQLTEIQSALADHDISSLEQIFDRSRSAYRDFVNR